MFPGYSPKPDGVAILSIILLGQENIQRLMSGNGRTTGFLMNVMVIAGI